MFEPIISVARACVAATICIAALSGTVYAGKSVVEEGRQIAFDRKKGNCLACHAMGDGSLPGNAGPALVEMKKRYPDKSALRAQIWDATKRNPSTMMPPFGRHQILSDEEIDKITEYVHTL